MLVAQSTEADVNSITPELFERFPDVESLARGSRREIESLIRSTGFYRQKAKYLQLTCQMLILHHRSEIPTDIMSLTRLPGVARKTANFVMAELFGTAEGVLVDMRVRRVVQRLHLSNGKSAEATENRLMEIVPKQDWIEFPRLVIELGDTFCTVQNPRCHKCPLHNLCPSANTFEPKSEILPS